MSTRLMPGRRRRRSHPMVRPSGLLRLRRLPRRVAWRSGLLERAASRRGASQARLNGNAVPINAGSIHAGSSGGEPDSIRSLAPPVEHVRTDELARLEAVLFLAREPLNTRRLAKLARLPDGTRARVLVRELNRMFDDAGSSFRVEPVAGGFQMLSRAAFGPWLRRLLDAHPQTRLSAPAMETLAIVAYRQPVSRSEIESIRGVGCEEMLRQLLERDLVAISGRSEEIGRPNLYVTTRNFMRAFGLGRLEDLPPIPG